MMFGERISFEAKLRLKSDLHLGSLMDVGTQTHEKQLLFDYEDRPLLPATSLKGVLRAALEEPDIYLGTPTDTERDGRKVSGVVAKLWLDDAPLTEPADDASFAGRGERCGPGIFFADHVAIDRATGSGKDNNFYRTQMVARDGSFLLTGFWLDPKDIDGFEVVLARVAAGIAAGAGTGKGAGRLVLETESLTLKRHGIGPDGFATEENFGPDETRAVIARITARAGTLDGPRNAARVVRLRLVAQSPYISIREHRADVGARQKIAQPLQTENGKPLLRSESLVGVLREKASWRAELDRARDALSNKEFVQPGAPYCDERFRRDVSDATDLTPTERLFGVGGWRARLRVVNCAPSEDCSAETVVLTGVSIDRITGASRDKFLYSQRAFTGACFDVTLAVEDVDDDVEADRAALVVFDELIEEITTVEGLELGHGITKGFGWFDVSRCEEEAS